MRCQNRPAFRSDALRLISILRIGLVLFAGVFVYEQLECRAADFPHWRGPTRNGIVGESSRFDGRPWPGKEPLWTRQVGEGSTSPVVAEGRLYSFGWWEGHDTLLCFDATDGREIWRQTYSCPRHGRRATGDEGLYSGPTSTPEFDSESGYLYTLSADGDLRCWDTKDKGSLIWKLNLYTAYDVPQRPRHGRSGRRDYGYTTAPFLHQNLVLVEVGAKEGTVIAFDKRTGKPAWASECKDPAGHTGGLVPMLIEGVPCLAVLTYQGLLVSRLDDGKTVAQYAWSTDFANNIATPAVFENSVLITSEYNRGAICRIDIDLKGAKKVWEQPFSSKVCSPVIHKGHIYWAWQKLHCLDFKTGAEQWSGGSFGDAGSCLVTSDDKLIIWGGQGKLVLAETAVGSPDAYRELAQRDRLGSSDVWPHVVLSDGRLYCKDREGRITCFQLGSP